jgi:hypothetical protein
MYYGRYPICRHLRYGADCTQITLEMSRFVTYAFTLVYCEQASVDSVYQNGAEEIPITHLNS